MAALTATLIGLGIAGGLFAGKKLASKGATAAPPIPAIGPAPVVTPAPVMQAEAKAAAVGQRKKARGDGRAGTILTGPRGLVSGSIRDGAMRTTTGTY